MKRFHQEFFDRPNDGTDARSVGQITSEALVGESRDVGVFLDQVGRYSFLEKLRSVSRASRRAPGERLRLPPESLGDFEDDLLTAKEDMLDPIKSFMHGPQRKAYDETIAFLREEEANFPDLPAEDVQPLRDLAAAEAHFRGNGLPAAKASVIKLRELIASLFATERATVAAIIDEHKAKLRALLDFRKLGEAATTQCLEKSVEARATMSSARFVTAIRDLLNRYRTQDYPAQLALVSRLATPPPAPPKPGGGAPPKPKPPAPTYVPPRRSVQNAICPLSGPRATSTAGSPPSAPRLQRN